MNDKLTALLDRIKQLETELLVEVEKKQHQFSYVIHDRKIHFKDGVQGSVPMAPAPALD